MGFQISKIIEKFWGHKDMKILMLGLDAAGKTTILYKLKLGEVVSSVPTIGFNVETLQHKRIKFQVWDIGGQCKLRMLWKHYYNNTDGLIYVVDSCDKERLQLAKEELHRILNEDEMKDASLLVFANKQDQGVMSVSEVAEALDLDRFKGRKWNIQGTCALTGDGLEEGIEWLGKNAGNSK